MSKDPKHIKTIGTIIGLIERLKEGLLFSILKFISKDPLRFKSLSFFDKYWPYNPPQKDNIKANTPPQIINRNKFSRAKFDAAAKGPGVGGTRTWGAKRPVDNATLSPTNDVFVCLDNVLLIFDKITKAASQKTGIETKYPMVLIAYGKGRFLSNFIRPLAIEIVPFDNSKEEPITVPKTINKPIFLTVFQKPEPITKWISFKGILIRKDNNKAAISRVIMGLIFR